MPEEVEKPATRTETSAPTLWLVGLPIGHTRDISLRALDLLRQTDLLLLEDRKTTARLFKALEIPFPRDLYYEVNEHSTPEDLTELIPLIKKAACPVLVSDAGMPVICDPGAVLVDLARSAHIQVRTAPGPVAFTVALALSGVGGHGFEFLGFPPRKTPEREKFFKSLGFRKTPAVFYETPYRLKKVLGELVRFVPGNKGVFVGVNLTAENEYHRNFLVRELGQAIDTIPGGPPVLIVY